MNAKPNDFPFRTLTAIHFRARATLKTVSSKLKISEDRTREVLENLAEQNLVIFDKRGNVAYVKLTPEGLNYLNNRRNT